MSGKQRVATREEMIAYVHHRLGAEAALMLRMLFDEQGKLSGLRWLREHGIEPQTLAEQPDFEQAVRPD